MIVVNLVLRSVAPQAPGSDGHPESLYAPGHANECGNAINPSWVWGIMCSTYLRNKAVCRTWRRPGRQARVLPLSSGLDLATDLAE